MIIGIEVFHDSHPDCRTHGAQVSREFMVRRDLSTGDPMIVVICPNCNEPLVHTFIGVKPFDDEE